MATDEDYTEVSRAQWTGVAEGWRRHAEELEENAPGAATEWMLEAVAPQPGERVLELACGPAEVGLRAARQTGPDGRVVLTDFSEAMVDVARERAAGLGNVELRVADAESLDLPDGDFDAALCRFGFMLMADPAAALRETHRVLRPGGRLALAVWAQAQENPWAFSFMRAIMEHFRAPPPDPDAPGMWTLADGGKLRQLLEGAGFGDVRIERVEGRMRYDSVDGWWDDTADLAGPAAALLRNMAEPDREAVRERIRVLAEPHTGPDGALDFPAAMQLAAARRH
jgi:SAM-dependent methyltransferase